MKAALRFLYRYLFCRRGHGIHSPFVYALVTDVIGEKRPYYCYGRLGSERSALKKRGVRLLPRKDYELLFRMANRFKPVRSLVIADDAGLSALYVTAFSKNAVCDSAGSWEEYLARAAAGDGCGGLDKYGLIVCPAPKPETLCPLPENVGDDAVMIICGAGAPDAAKRFWQNVCKHPKASVSIDMRRIGAVFFSPKLHRKTYRCFF